MWRHTQPGDRTWLLDTPDGRDSLSRRTDDPSGGLVGRVLTTRGTELHL